MTDDYKGMTGLYSLAQSARILASVADLYGDEVAFEWLDGQEIPENVPQEPPVIQVKQLVWETSLYGRKHSPKNERQYRVEEGGKKVMAQLNGERTTWFPFDTLEEAKAACFADYEKRIRSAIEGVE